MDKPSSIAIHEAAHACVGYSVGTLPTAIMILDEDTGFVKFDNRFKVFEDDAILISLSGSVAEHIYYGTSEYSSDDWEELRAAGFNLQELAELEQKTTNLINRLHDDVFKIARHLDKYGFIKSGKEFQKILLGGTEWITN